MAHHLQHILCNKLEYDDNYWRKFIIICRKFTFIRAKFLIMKIENMDDETNLPKLS